MIQKIVQKPAVTCTLKAITNDRKGKLDQKIVMWLLEESSGLVSVFKETKLFNYFSLLNIYKFHRKAGLGLAALAFKSVLGLQLQKQSYDQLNLNIPKQTVRDMKTIQDTSIKTISRDFEV